MILVDIISNLGPFTLREKLDMRVACKTIISLRKERYVGQLKYDIIGKSTTEWINYYEVGYKVRRSTIFSKDRRKLIATNFPTRRTWFVSLWGSQI